MTTALTRRLEALEAAQDQADAANPQPSEAVLLFVAILDAVREPTPYGFRERPREAKALYLRYKAGTETDNDRAIIASLPDYGIDPLELLQVLVEVHELL